MKRCVVYLFVMPILIGIHSSLFCQNAPVVVNYTYEPAVQHFNVPPGVGAITITIAGAKGGGTLGGKGASFTGICNIISPHILSVVIGQRGDSGVEGGSGGGGGSWVYDSNIVLYTPNGTTGLLAVAAGGGGQANAGYHYIADTTVITVDTTYTGFPGGTDLETNGTNPVLSPCIEGGIGGNGGEPTSCLAGGLSGGGGAGWLSNGKGEDSPSGLDESHYFSMARCSYGNGGYGGGGGGGYDNDFNGVYGIGGGGGGYNGGGSGYGGGGGGSYLNGTLVGAATASDTGNGFVTISYMPPLQQVIAIYPNPNSGIFTVNGIRQEQLIEIYNCLGQKIQAFQANSAFLQFDLSTYANGVYMVVVRNADGSKVEQTKVVKI